jgi:cell shape-determining protein MreD
MHGGFLVIHSVLGVDKQWISPHFLILCIIIITMHRTQKKIK